MYCIPLTVQSCTLYCAVYLQTRQSENIKRFTVEGKATSPLLRKSPNYTELYSDCTELLHSECTELHADCIELHADCTELHAGCTVCLLRALHWLYINCESTWQFVGGSVWRDMAAPCLYWVLEQGCTLSVLSEGAEHSEVLVGCTGRVYRATHWLYRISASPS